MNDNLTMNGVTFALSFKDQAGSERRDASRGVNLPCVMSVKNQPYTDSKTKVKGQRTVLRFDRYKVASTGTIVPVSAYLVTTIPEDGLIVDEDVNDVLAHIRGCLNAPTDVTNPGLNLATSLFINKEL